MDTAGLAAGGAATLDGWSSVGSVLETSQARLLRLPEEIALEMNMRLAELTKPKPRPGR